MNKSNNPPAFPNPIGKGVLIQFEGMSLRDYFAAKAMQGELASQSQENGMWTDKCVDMLARKAYFIADAMLKERDSNA